MATPARIALTPGGEDLRIHADRTQPALVHAHELPWMATPEPGVERRMLERVGGEVALASSIVRYRPGSRFAAHGHELGEEFIVLEGMFSDEHGDYAEGSYARNPPGSSHAPFSNDGCVIFVKLRQMRAHDRQTLRVLAQDLAWRAGSVRGHERATLHATADEQVTVERLASGCHIAPRSVVGGEEIFVLSGSVFVGSQGRGRHDHHQHEDEDNERPLVRWSWRRNAAGQQPALLAQTDALLWIKRGHLPA